MSRVFYPRLSFLIMMILFFILSALFILVSIGIIGLAFKKLGFSPLYSILLLYLSLFGSLVNIPVKEITSRQTIVSNQVIDYFFFRYIIPPVEVNYRTILAINLGGAVLPVVISGFLITKVNLYEALLGIFIMTVLINRMARPVQGLGIAVPALVPPLLAALVALLISPHQAPLVAYISGTLGCLIGADLLNLKKIADLRAPVASIGGAGTFDGIFLTGIISVLLA